MVDVCIQHSFFWAAMLLASPAKSLCTLHSPALALSSVASHLDYGSSPLPAFPLALQFAAHEGGLAEILGAYRVWKSFCFHVRLPTVSLTATVWPREGPALRWKQLGITDSRAVGRMNPGPRCHCWYHVTSLEGGPKDPWTRELGAHHCMTKPAQAELLVTCKPKASELYGLC